MTLIDLAIPFAVSALVAALATPLVSRLAQALEIVDRPNERKVNRRPGIPLLGGIAVALGFLVGVSVAAMFASEGIPLGQRLDGFLIGGALLLAIGAFDDRWGLTASPKLLVQIVAAAAAFYYGFRIDYVTGPLLGATPIDLPLWAAFLLTTLWITGVTNAVNLIDGLDGLSAGVGAIIAATLSFICWQAGQPAGVILGAALVGALLGFLPFNFPPGRIFLGDSGALFIGFALSLLALEGYRKAALLTFVVPLLALAVPLLDTSLSILRRLRHRSPIFDADRGHMHHRLLKKEGSQRAAVLSLYFLTACFCVIAVSFTRLHGYAAVTFLGAVVLLTLRLLWNLGVLSAVAEDADPAANGAPSDSGNLEGGTP